MNTTINFYVIGEASAPLKTLIGAIHQLTEKNTMLLKNLTEQLKGVNDTLSKAKGEILTRIDALETSLGDVEIPQEAVDQLEGLKTVAKSLDDIVPDPAPEPEPTPEPPAPDQTAAA